MKDFGEFIRYKRLDKMTQRELSTLIGIGCPYLSKLENGIEPPPSEEVLNKIAVALNIAQEDIFYIAKKMPTELKEFILENNDIYDLLIQLKNSPDEIRSTFMSYIQGLLKTHEADFTENNSIMFLVNPVDSCIVDVNKAALDFYGFEHEEFCRKCISDINPLPEEILTHKMAQAQEGEKECFYFTHRMADNTFKDVKVISKPYDIGDKTYLLSVIEEIR